MKEGAYLFKKRGVTPDDFAGVYKEIAEVIGVDATVLLHDSFKGQQINLPKKLYTKEYVVIQVENGNSPESIKKVAREFGYTERRLRQLIKEMEEI